MRVEHIYHHRASGELLTGNFRIVRTVRDGKVCRAEEYHDRAMVESFMRLFATP
jgi:ketosteroid isomerase-like protein